MSLKVLLISRKRANEVGGLGRFYRELSKRLKWGFFDADVIHLCDATLLPLGLILKLLLRKPLAVTAHGLDLTYKNKIYQSILNFCLPMADGVILDSEKAKKLLKRKDSVWVINPGISVSHFKKSEFVNLLDLKDKTVLLTVGNLVLRKGHRWFIKQVFKKLPKNFVYLIVGEGPERKNIEGLSERVILMGRINDCELSHVIKRADIYVCPNIKVRGNFEGFGIAVGEAAGMGLPVVASNVDGLGEIIKNNKNGLLVKPLAKEFLKAIKKFENKKVREGFGKRARAFTLKNYSWKKTVAGYINVFSIFLGRN